MIGKSYHELIIDRLKLTLRQGFKSYVHDIIALLITTPLIHILRDCELLKKKTNIKQTNQVDEDNFNSFRLSSVYKLEQVYNPVFSSIQTYL